MHRTQILLEEWQVEVLRSRAERGGESLSALLRSIVSEYLRPSLEARAAKIDEIRGIAEGPEDLARGHDRYLAGGEE